MTGLSLEVFVGLTSLHIGLTLALLGVAVTNARNIGVDEQARQAAAEAEEQAQYAARRMTRHVAEYHGGHVEEADEVADA